ncbi:transposase [Halalkalibacter okhensis]|uniref:Uncharacterized protein n=1 Tax=Halalkalibacter okhensis TaxID=333138 RepID=A0A0B0IN75_9BACI|nr:transposase [Halalkalibacter okhensis]KHF41131.1 hypothetical protein LQ50_05015 [Halalkalibacter okhensis]
MLLKSQTIGENPTNDSSQIGPLGILDSSEVKLPKKAGEWAYCSKTKNAIKVHLVLSNDNGALHPEQFVLSTAAYADHELTDYLMNIKSLTYVMDRGYLNYSHFTIYTCKINTFKDKKVNLAGE